MTRRLLALALMLGAIPVIAGCDETAKANQASKADDKTNADKPAEPAKTAKKVDDALDFPTTDPLIANAIQSRQQLVDQEEALLERLDELRKLLASAKADPVRLRQSVEEFLVLAKEIRRVVTQAGESMTFLDESTGALARSMKHLGNSYRSAAGLFRLKARDYSERKLRDQLTGFADDFDAIANSIPERAQALQAFRKSLPKLKVKVREANAFLDDVVLYLSSHPGIGADPRERYSVQFESFVSTFSDLIRTIDEFRSAFRERAISKVIHDGFIKDAMARKKLEDERRETLAQTERAKQEEAVRIEQGKREEALRTASGQPRIPSVQLERESSVPMQAAEDTDSTSASQPSLSYARYSHADVPQPVAKPPCDCIVISTSMVSSAPYRVVTYQPIVREEPTPCRFRLLPLFQRCP